MPDDNEDVIILTYPHFVLLTVIAVYFQLSFVRSVLFDIVFIGITLFFGLKLFVAYKHGTKVIVDIRNHHQYLYADKKCYSRNTIYLNRDTNTEDFPWYSYSVQVMSSQRPTYSVASRSMTPDYKRQLLNETRSEQSSVSSSSGNPIYTTDILDKEEKLSYSCLMKEVSKDVKYGNIDLFPKEAQIGKIVWMQRGCGRILAVEPIHNILYFFFHPCDCSTEDGEPPLFQVGERVIFNISIKDQRVFAVGVRRVAKRTVSSPDFSRLIMRNSEAASLQIDHLEL